MADKIVDLNPIINEIINLSDPNLMKWTLKQRELLPKLMANIFALWTLSSAENYFDVDENENDE
jgi:hypothetical protein